MPTTQTTFHRPHTHLALSELPRAIGELQVFAHAIPYLRMLSRGDGHRVMVLPGFTGDDPSTASLRWYLLDRGYRAIPWKLGRNLGPTDHILDGMTTLVLRAAARGERTSIIGWSLGGIFGRELARKHPEAIRSVITLGSPFRLTVHDRDQTHAARQYEAVSALHSQRVDVQRPREEDRPGMPVPVTNIYTRADGVAPWRSCIDVHGERCENVEVPGSHSGLGHNPFAMAVIADRLAQPDGAWEPYRPSPCLASMVRVGPVPSKPAVTPAA